MTAVRETAAPVSRTAFARFAITLAAIAAVAGCSPEAYRRSADAQVYGILAQRKKAVLDYQPETTVETPQQ